MSPQLTNRAAPGFIHPTILEWWVRRHCGGIAGVPLVRQHPALSEQPVCRLCGKRE